MPEPVAHTTEYVAKFVCGNFGLSAGVEPETAPVARGDFVTAFNIYNPGTKNVKFAGRVSVALPHLAAGPVSPFIKGELTPGQAAELDCSDIREAVAVTDATYTDLNAQPFAKGIAVILSGGKLDIIAVYTASRTVNNQAGTDRVGGSNGIQVLPVVGRARKGTVQAITPP
ncbi:MAG: hypothetical protein ACREQP_15460 [Candidatus Binatia bacterium]